MPDGATLNLNFTAAHFKKAHTWARQMAVLLRDTLEKKLQEEIVWSALRKLTQPAVWRSMEIPQVELNHIAEHCRVDSAELADCWVCMRAQVGALLEPKGPIGEESTPEVFRSTVLLPGLAEAPKSLLQRTLVTAAITIGNNVQLERDMKAIRDLWHKRTK